MCVRATHLHLEDFRTYTELDLPLSDGVTVFVGPNGAGKTNLLEAVLFLALGTSPRAGDDSDVVRWGAAHARVRADVTRSEGERRLEAVIFARLARAPGAGTPVRGAPLARDAEQGRRPPKRFLLDGAAKRGADLAGEVRVVAFFPEDVALLAEAPAARRRYLDGMIGQVDRRYRFLAAELGRVLEQRNALLRRAREEGNDPDPAEMAFWDEELVRLGSAVAARRYAVVEELAPQFGVAHALLAGGAEASVAYACQAPAGSGDEIAERYRRLLREKAEREVWQGTTLVGPHRDDLSVTAQGRALPSFASRGEHRTAVLALKLAEAAWMVEQTAEHPVYLLDDVLSELDLHRRERLAAAVPRHAQCLITAAVATGIPERLATGAELRAVVAGTVDAFPR